MVTPQQENIVPLRCVDPTTNTSLQAFDLSAEAWRTLAESNRSRRHLRMPCCGAQVVLKRSRRGIQFFAHKAVGECTTAPETEAHLRLKEMAVTAARACGWHADTEVSGTAETGETWRADVLARKGTVKVAVEIQWSNQTDEETLRRQAVYARSSVRGLWLLRQAAFPVDRDLPAARIGGDLDDGLVALIPTGPDWQRVPMQTFLEAAFSRRFHFGVPLGVSGAVSVRAGHMFCWDCGSQTRIVTGIDLELGPHRCVFTIPDLDQYPGIFAAVRPYLSSNIGIGPIKRRHSRAQGRRYLSNGCAHCDALLGEFHEHDAWEDQEVVASFAVRISDQWRQAITAHEGRLDFWGVYLEQPS